MADKAKLEREELERKADEERRKLAPQHGAGQGYDPRQQGGYNVRGGYGGGRGGYSKYNTHQMSPVLVDRPNGRTKEDAELTAWPSRSLLADSGRGGYQNGYQQDSRYQNNNPRASYEDRDRPNQAASSSMGPPPTGPRQPPSGPRNGAQTGQAPPTGPRSAPTLPSSSSAPGGSTSADPNIDLAAIKARYLGVGPDANKRKIRKTGDKKFVFDWEAEEDTGAGSLIDARSAGGVMLGGQVGGMGDAGRGRQAAAGAAPDQSVPACTSRSQPDLSLTGHCFPLNRYADALERRNASKAGTDERHWTEKPLEEMKDRDWRIFREDFSIAARGQYISVVLT